MAKKQTQNPNEDAVLAEIKKEFFAWTYDKAWSWNGFIFVFVTVVGTGYNVFVAFGISNLPLKWHLSLISGTQLGLIAIITAILAFIKRPHSKTNHLLGDLAVNQFKSWWTGLWISWLFLYGGITSWNIFKTLLEQQVSLNYEPIIYIFQHLFNNAATLILFMLFHILAYPTVKNSRSRSRRKWNVDLRALFWVGIFVIMALIESALVASSFISCRFELAKTFSHIFGIIYGILAATALALVVGRLDSNLLSIPKWVIIILFIYAGVQPSFDFVLMEVSVEPEKMLLRGTQEIILVVALICKAIFFLVMFWLIQTNRLLYYMVKYREMDRTADESRKEFLENVVKNKKNS